MRLQELSSAARDVLQRLAGGQPRQLKAGLPPWLVALFAIDGEPELRLPLEFGVARHAGGLLVLLLRRSVPLSRRAQVEAVDDRQNVLARAHADGDLLRLVIRLPAKAADWSISIRPAAGEPAEAAEGWRLAGIEHAAPESGQDFPFSDDYRAIRDSGLFDPQWYARYGDHITDPQRAFDHYYFIGRRLGRAPCFYFDPEWYLSSNQDVRQAGHDPLLHYLRDGEKEGRRPVPIFDPAWYGEHYKLDPARVCLLKDFIDNLLPKRRSPCPHMDVAFYLETYSDVEAAGIDPVEHYVHTGYRENRDPAPNFNSAGYIRRYLGGSYAQNPLYHYIVEGRQAGHSPRGSDEVDRGVAGEILRSTREGEHFETFAPPPRGARPAAAKVIALHLPQFHAVPENDDWWGKGFTEWRNVARGVPRFRGHYQPRVPRDLGYYDLSRPEAIRRQVELAAAAGLHGFCFYFYWFNRKRLLETPLDLFVADETLDFPFCLMWANENWTRRWDGREADILLKQDYERWHDADLVASVARYFASPRYIRIGGRPLFFIYRPDEVPDGRARFAEWRRLWREEHGVEPLFFMAQSFHNVDPADWGLDGAVEFPPHKFSSNVQPLAASDLSLLDAGFFGTVFSYADFVEKALEQPTPDYPLIRTVVPSWDNDARRQGAGSTVVQGATPALYERWLRGAIAYAEKHPVGGEPIVFVNAWNEWAEGAYLEPDVHFGGAYLNATARAVYGLSATESRRKVLLVGHDAHPHGAQTLLLAIAACLRRQFGMQPSVLLLENGPMLAEYQSVCRTFVAPRTTAERLALLSRLAEEGHHAAIANTVVTGILAPLLREAGLRFVSLVHELPRLIRERNLERRAELIVGNADAVVFAGEAVRDGFLAIAGDGPAEPVVRPQGLYNARVPAADAAARLREDLGIPAEARIVLNAAYADLRKGFDLFLAAAKEVVLATDDVHFVWLGKLAPEVEQWMLPAADDPILAGRFHHIGYIADPQAYVDLVGGADLFFLSSREDPFPSVILDALAAGLPLLAFDHAGGFTGLVGEFGRLLPTTDALGAARAIREMLDAADEPPAARAERRRVVVAERFSHDLYCAELIGRLDPDYRRVSVIVPNYNYARHLRARLASIFEQTAPVFEVIVLDDASTDDSLEVIETVRAEYGRDIRLVVNDENSGSAFAQWRRGLALARGDYVWIAEADDVADRNFLAALLQRMVDTGAAFGFTDSWQIDDRDRKTGASYAAYCDDGEAGRFHGDFVLDGRAFAAECLSVKNTILNVSAVLWRREALATALAAAGEALAGHKVAGDWRLYAEAALAGGPVAYLAQPLNGHRRHSVSVTHALDKQRHFDEIVRMHRFVADSLHLDEAQQRRMQHYQAEVAAQFGLAPAGNAGFTAPQKKRRTRRPGAG